MKRRLERELTKKQLIGRIVTGVLKRKTEHQVMARVDDIVARSFEKAPFRYQMTEKVPQAAIRPVAHWFIGKYMGEAGLSKIQQAQLRKLLRLTESGCAFLSKKGAMPREVIQNIDSIGLTGDLDKLYDLFHKVMCRNRNVRAEYIDYLYANSKHPLGANEKIHIIQFTPNYISDLFSRALDVLWAYKKMRQKQR